MSQDECGNELKNDTARRWIRIMRTAVNLAGLVDGFTWVEGMCEWKVDGALEAKGRSGPTTQWILTLTMRKRTNLRKVRTVKRIRKR
ncbi:hypothetical protein EV363DRAFT_644473 [Boletus edulis]|nr:hypothetical protein EV363DRAFT_644473 [Boletus edulis]